MFRHQPVTFRCTKLLVVGCVAMRHSYKPASAASTGVISKFHVCKIQRIKCKLWNIINYNNRYCCGKTRGNNVCIQRASDNSTIGSNAKTLIDR